MRCDEAKFTPMAMGPYKRERDPSCRSHLLPLTIRRRPSAISASIQRLQHRDLMAPSSIHRRCRSPLPLCHRSPFLGEPTHRRRPVLFLCARRTRDISPVMQVLPLTIHHHPSAFSAFAQRPQHHSRGAPSPSFYSRWCHRSSLPPPLKKP
jgi:hypothetical protein